MWHFWFDECYPFKCALLQQKREKKFLSHLETLFAINNNTILFAIEASFYSSVSGKIGRVLFNPDSQTLSHFTCTLP